MTEKEGGVLERAVNGFQIITKGGFVTPRYWAVCLGDEIVGIYFQFKKAKEACLKADFNDAYQGRL